MVNTRVGEIETFCYNAIDSQIVHELVTKYSHRLPSITVTIFNCERSIRDVSNELFAHRPATPPYVWMLLVFVESMHRKHPEIPKRLLVSATARALERTKFDPHSFLRCRVRWLGCASVFLVVSIFCVYIIKT